MGISEVKKKIVIDNYFKEECDVNTSIKEAFTKGFELGLKKAPMPQPKTGHWIPVSEKLPDKEGYYLCSVRYMYPPYNFFEPEKVKYMNDVTIQKFAGEFNIEVKAWMPLPPCYKPQESEGRGIRND